MSEREIFNFIKQTVISTYMYVYAEFRWAGLVCKWLLPFLKVTHQNHLFLTLAIYAQTSYKRTCKD